MSNLAAIYTDRDEFDKAVAGCQKALALDDRDYMTDNNLGVA